MKTIDLSQKGAISMGMGVLASPGGILRPPGNSFLEGIN